MIGIKRNHTSTSSTESLVDLLTQSQATQVQSRFSGEKNIFWQDVQSYIRDEFRIDFDEHYILRLAKYLNLSLKTGDMFKRILTDEQVSALRQAATTNPNFDQLAAKKFMYNQFKVYLSASGIEYSRSKFKIPILFTSLKGRLSSDQEDKMRQDFSGRTKDTLSVQEIAHYILKNFGLDYCNKSLYKVRDRILSQPLKVEPDNQTLQDPAEDFRRAAGVVKAPKLPRTLLENLSVSPDHHFGVNWNSELNELLAHISD